MNRNAETAASSRVLIVDDHPLFREGLRQLIGRDPELKVCGEAANSEEALHLIREEKPDVVTVDISMEGSNGIDLIKQIRSEHDDLPLLVISMHDESLYAERALRAGAMGYVMKHEPPKVVRTALQRVLGGEMYLSERLASTLISRMMRGGADGDESSVSQLSDRELEVFRLLGEGRGTRQIAAELGLSIPTINSFRARIKEKLKLRSSSELLLHAIRWVQEQAR